MTIKEIESILKSKSKVIFNTCYQVNCVEWIDSKNRKHQMIGYNSIESAAKSLFKNPPLVGLKHSLT